MDKDETKAEEVVDTNYHVSIGEWDIDVESETVDMLDTDDSKNGLVAMSAIADIISEASGNPKVKDSYLLSAVKKLLAEKENRQMASNATDYLYNGIQAIIWLGNEGVLSGSQTYACALVFLKIVKEGLVPESGRLETSVNRLKMLADKLKKRDASRA